MPYSQEQHQRMQLNRWVRTMGYADIDTYLAAGGSVIELVGVLRNLRDSVEMAQTALAQFQVTITAETKPILREPDLSDLPLSAKREPVIGPEALARAEAEVNGEEPDPHNAHIQGADAA